MKKIFFIISLLTITYSCTISEKEQSFQKETIIQEDSLEIEQVKIQTH